MAAAITPGTPPASSSPPALLATPPHDDGYGVTAQPNASPLVTAELGDRLCRLASQHHLSEYNRLRRFNTLQHYPHPHQQYRACAEANAQWPPMPHYQQRQPSSPTLKLSKRLSLKSPPSVARSHSVPVVIPRMSPSSPSSSPKLNNNALLLYQKTNSSYVREGYSSTISHKGFSSVLGSYFSALTGSWTSQTTSPVLTTSVASKSPDQSLDALNTRLLAHHHVSGSGCDTPVDIVASGCVVPETTINPPVVVVAEHNPVRRGSPTKVENGLPRQVDDRGNAVKTSLSHPMNISPILPPELLELFWQFRRDQHDEQLPKLALPVDLFDLTGPYSSQAYQVLLSSLDPNILESFTIQCHPSSRIQHGRMGNLLLSSCPGKKVRLDNTSHANQSPTSQPVPLPLPTLQSIHQPPPHPFVTTTPTPHIRSAICRDLDSDFSRAVSLGIKAVICCIDDAELKFLGSPWKEYSSCAKKWGLHVMRLPMSDGFAPHCIEDMNVLLEEVLKDWTWKGKDVLCHCRGGVGRAGLVACCWMLQCGLMTKGERQEVEQVSPVSMTSSTLSTSSSLRSDRNGEQIRERTIHSQHRTVLPTPFVLEQVEKVIDVVRRRRSTKAIETPYQVHYVMEFAQSLSDEQFSTTTTTTPHTSIDQENLVEQR